VPAIYMRTMLSIYIALISITSCFADQQAGYVAYVWGHPTEDFSNRSDEQLTMLAQADAMVYFQDHKHASIDFGDASTMGTAHAFKHHLIGEQASRYEMDFALALHALLIGSE
jgi:hypothetical protein